MAPLIPNEVDWIILMVVGRHWRIFKNKSYLIRSVFHSKIFGTLGDGVGVITGVQGKQIGGFEAGNEEQKINGRIILEIKLTSLPFTFEQSRGWELKMTSKSFAF